MRSSWAAYVDNGGCFSERHEKYPTIPQDERRKKVSGDMKDVLRHQFEQEYRSFSFVKNKVVSSRQSVQHKDMQVMRSSWSASIVGDLNEPAKYVSSKCVIAENRLLHCKKEFSNVVGRVYPCTNRGKYVGKDLSMFSSAATHNGDFISDIAKSRLQKPLEKIQQEKKKEKVAAAESVSSNQHDDVLSVANESMEDVQTEGFNLLVQNDENSNNAAAQKGQRRNVFQSECKIKDKVCKLVIDGGSFTNIISRDVVQELSLSTWRYPTPHHVKWMNPAGKLKITHKVRVPFSVGNYVDKVECDVLPIDVCHLVLGRPWEYDLNAIHEGRSNQYSFVHKGVNHVLKPMHDFDIKADVFLAAKQKKKSLMHTPKPRTTLLKVADPEISCKEIKEPSNNMSKPRTALLEEGEDDAGISPKLISSSNLQCCTDHPSDVVVQIGAFSFNVKREENMNDQRTIAATYSEKECHSAYISEGNAFKNHKAQFGSFSFVANHKKTPEVLSASDAMPCNAFVGPNIKKDENNRETRPYVKIGSMFVAIDDSKEPLKLLNDFTRVPNTFLPGTTRLPSPSNHGISRYGNSKSVRFRYGAVRQAWTRNIISPSYRVRWG